MVEKVTKAALLTIAHSQSRDNTVSKLSSGQINGSKPSNLY